MCDSEFNSSKESPTMISGTKGTDTEMSSNNDSTVVETPAKQPIEQESDLPACFPKCCGKPILHGKPEALGWLLGLTGQTVILLGVGTFLIPALVYFAKKEVGCPTEIPEGQDEIPVCHKKVKGIIKPSSLITTTTSILSLCVALFTPLMGAIVDYTPHRRTIGRTIAALYCCVLFPQIFISESNWFPLAILLILLALMAVALTLVLHAYLPELTDNEEELNDLTKVFVAGPGVTVIFFIIAVIGLAFAFGVDSKDGPTAQIAAALALIFICVAFGFAWGTLLGERPAANTLKEGEWLATAGFKQIYQTLKRLYRQDSCLLWFFLGIAFGDVKPLTSIALSFLSDQQQFSSAEVGYAAIIMLLCTVPGAALSAFFSRRINPIRSSMLALVLMTVTTCIGAFVMTGANQKLRSYLIVACWGAFGSWKLTSTNMLVAAILPSTGQDTELMGFYLFSDTSLSWLPPLIFTAFNEAGFSQRVGLSFISIFFIAGMLFYLNMGTYDDAVRSANRLVSKPNNEEVIVQLACTEESKAPIKQPDPLFADDNNTDVEDTRQMRCSSVSSCRWEQDEVSVARIQATKDQHV